MDKKPLPIALREATAALEGVSDTARLDAELLAAHVMGMERMDMLARMADLDAPDEFDAMVARRMADEPVAYITGVQAFWDIELSVTPNVLIPRSDSETLIEAADGYFADRQPKRILDLGTGSGALLLAALSLFPDARGIGIDASEAALEVARGNAQALGFDDRADMQMLSWHDADWVDRLNGPFDLILCNPPYIGDAEQLDPMVADHEPHAALFAGADGLSDYRAAIPAIPALLAPGGIALFEIGHEQAQAVSKLAKESGLSAQLHHDLSGKPRCVAMKDARASQIANKSRHVTR